MDTSIDPEPAADADATDPCVASAGSPTAARATSKTRVRRCGCGTLLARDNTARRCSACARRPREQSGPPCVPPDFWDHPQMRAALATREMGAVIHAYRTHPQHGQPLTQRRVAGWGGFNQAYVSRVESGLARIDDLNRLAHWARVLSIPAHLLWFAPPHSRAGTGAGGPVGAILDWRSPGERRDEPTDRRDVLRLGGAVTAGLTSDTLAAHLAVEPDLMHTALDTGTLGGEHLRLLEETSDRLGVLTVTTTTPATVLDEAVTGFRSVRQLLTHRQRTDDQTRLVRTAARFATIVGNLLNDEGHHGVAASWYRAANHAARDVGDTYLADIALGEHAYIPAYAGDPRGVLAMVDPRLSRRTGATPAVAFLWASKARAHAALGESDAFAQANEHARTALAASPARYPSSGLFSFSAGKLAFYETSGRVKLGDSQAALGAATNALDTMDPAAQDRSSVRLDQAAALAQLGDVSEACRIATAVLRAPATYVGSVVLSRAHDLDTLVRASRDPAVREWRDVLRMAERKRQAVAGTPRVR